MRLIRASAIRTRIHQDTFEIKEEQGIIEEAPSTFATTDRQTDINEFKALKRYKKIGRRFAVTEDFLMNDVAKLRNMIIRRVVRNRRRQSGINETLNTIDDIEFSSISAEDSDEKPLLPTCRPDSSYQRTARRNAVGEIELEHEIEKLKNMQIRKDVLRNRGYLKFCPESLLKIVL